MSMTAVCATAAGLLWWGGTTTNAIGSSHREAPLITEMPKVDSTDLYVFNSYEPGREGYVTIIADYQPFQIPFGGPNFFFLDPNALYEIHVDHTGDGREDITFQSRFKNTLNNLRVPAGGKNIPVPLINIGPISGPNSPTLNIEETYTLDIMRGDRRTGTRQSAHAAAGIFTKPTDNIGQKSIPNYESYARSFIHTFTMPECDAGPARVFVGQRKEPFFINISEAFDLFNLNPLGPVDAKRNNLKDFNVTSFALEVSAACLCPNGPNKVIGVWQTASLRQQRTLRPQPTYERPKLDEGAWTQVSRLGMPLVNELVIGLKDKDRFNASKPVHDAQFADYVTNPSLPILLQTLQPPTILLLRATIRQSVHEFDGALAALDRLLATQPTNAQAWLTKASILQVQGRYDEARSACQPLARLASPQVAVTA